MSEKKFGELVTNPDGSHADDCCCHECGYGLGNPISAVEREALNAALEAEYQPASEPWNPRPNESASDALKRFAEGHGMEFAFNGVLPKLCSAWIDFPNGTAYRIEPEEGEYRLFAGYRHYRLGSGSLAQMHALVEALKGLQ